MKKILITDLVHELLIEGFEKAGYTVDYFPDIRYDEVRRIISNYF